MPGPVVSYIEVEYFSGFAGTQSFTGDEYSFDIVDGCLVIFYGKSPIEAHPSGAWKSVSVDTVER